MNKKRKIIWITVALLAVIVATVVVTGHNRQISLNLSERQVVLPYENGVVRLFNGGLFAVDTGSSTSTITSDMLKRLRNMGMPVSDSYMPIIGHAPYSLGCNVSVHNYKVSLPVEEFRFAMDTVATSGWEPTGRIVSTIDNVEFVLDDSSEISVLGMDFLEHFVVEYCYSLNSLVLGHEVQDGYRYLAELKNHLLFYNMLGLEQRYYVEATIDDETSDFFLDTGLDFISMKLPYDDHVYSRRELYDNVFRTRDGRLSPIKYTDGAWVELGNRAGVRAVYYTNDGLEKYSLNPFTFFAQDVVFDFPGKKLYLRPFTIGRKRPLHAGRR